MKRLEDCTLENMAEKINEIIDHINSKENTLCNSCSNKNVLCDQCNPVFNDCYTKR